MTQQTETFAVILIKCKPGDEREIRKAIDRASTERVPLCFRPSGMKHDDACTHVSVRETAYCFGPFDFVIVLHSPDVGYVERFVVDCIRAPGKIVDTQTILGLTLSTC